MGRMVVVFSGIGMLIALFLVVKNGDKSVQIINSLGGNAVKGISTLQGNYIPKA